MSAAIAGTAGRCCLWNAVDSVGQRTKTEGRNAEESLREMVPANDFLENALVKVGLLCAKR